MLLNKISVRSIMRKTTTLMRDTKEELNTWRDMDKFIDEKTQYHQDVSSQLDL